jgi:hypothetical protein
MVFYCAHVWGSSEQDECDCIENSGTARGCVLGEEDTCYITVVFYKHPEYGCTPDEDGACQGAYKTQFPENSYNYCGELT